MSASSESRRGARARDVIDLDRYMRRARPAPPAHARERLIVDAGGVDRLPVEVTSSSSGTLPPRAPDHTKRYSHDSGVSDGSYLRQRHRPHRRLSESKYRDSSRAAGSNSSVREFKAACQKALREQQEQIARVTELCEKLVQPRIEQNLTNIQNNKDVRENICTENHPQLPEHLNCASQNNNQRSQCSPEINQNLNHTKQNFTQNVTQVNRVQRLPSAGTSDTCSSFSSRGIRVRDRHRSDSCKTYQLIMGKLDELSHMFATRRTAANTGYARDSSGSVLVCDKLVATDNGINNTPIVQVMHSSRISDREYSVYSKRKAAINTMHAQNPMDCQWNNTNNIGSAGDEFDLDNPLHLYAQAKRLQTLHVSNQRDPTRSGDITEDNSPDKTLDTSLCALCRGYWRVVRRYFRQQFFGTCT